MSSSINMSSNDEGYYLMIDDNVYCVNKKIQNVFEKLDKIIENNINKENDKYLVAGFLRSKLCDCIANRTDDLTMYCLIVNQLRT